MRNALLVLVAACLFPSSLPANPFVGSKETPASVRPPSFAAPFTDLQADFRERIAQTMRGWKDTPGPGFVLGLCAFSFLYGILHAAGPGHRKTVVFSLFLTRRSAWHEPVAAGFLSAGIHAGTSVILILFYSFLVSGISALTGSGRMGTWMEGGTYLVLAFLAAVLLGKKAFEAGRPVGAGGTAKAGLYGMLAVSSLIPCPGATMLMIFSVQIGMVAAGILSVLAMSIGMALVIAAAGLLGHAGREGLFRGLKAREGLLRSVSSVLEIGAYVLILAFSLYMAWPFLLSLLRA